MSIVTEEDFVRAVCSRLDASIADLDPAVTTRLDLLREAALRPASPETRIFAPDTLVEDVRHSLIADSVLPAEINARLDAARKEAVARMHKRASNPLLVLG